MCRFPVAGQNEATFAESDEKCRMVGSLILGRSVVVPHEKTKPGVLECVEKCRIQFVAPFVSRLCRHSEAIDERGASTVFRLFGN
jgi:hypothetical protein